MPNTVEIPAPDYVARYPSLRKVQLAAVKEGLYHPKLPTFRRMDMDTAAHQLPDEHCRTTTSCGPADFNNARATYFRPSTKRYSGANITDTGRSLRETLHNDIKLLNIDWAAAKGLDSLSSKQVGDLRFTGYAVRYLKPTITSSWRYTLQDKPKLDQYGQCPTPVNIYYPQYSRYNTSEFFR